MELAWLSGGTAWFGLENSFSVIECFRFGP